MHLSWSGGCTGFPIASLLPRTVQAAGRTGHPGTGAVQEQDDIHKHAKATDTNTTRTQRRTLLTNNRGADQAGSSSTSPHLPAKDWDLSLKPFPICKLIMHIYIYIYIYIRVNVHGRCTTFFPWWALYIPLTGGLTDGGTRQPDRRSDGQSEREREGHTEISDHVFDEESESEAQTVQLS